jgi:hypothetical protein
MKALSIKQPWAWLICKGYKDIENRGWKIGRKPQGGFPICGQMDFGEGVNFPFRVYVHASKEIDKIDLPEYRGNDNARGFVTYARTTQPIPFGSIIGEVDITGCVTESKSPWFVGPYGFTLANPVLYDKPIPYRGQLRFFEVKL